MTVALIGLAAGTLSMTGAAPSATASLVFQAEGVDAQTVSRQAQGALAQVSGEPVFDKAGAKLGISGADVREATAMSVSSDAMSIVVKAHGPSLERAVEIANAVAVAAIEVYATDVASQLADLEAATTRLIQGKPLSDAGAERARVTRLGESLADNQGKVVAQGNRIRLLAPATANSAASASSKVGGIFGLLGGLLLGIAAVALVGRRRGKPRSEAELRRLYPDAMVTTPAELHLMSHDDDWLIQRVVLASPTWTAIPPLLADELGHEDGARGCLDVSVSRPAGPAFRRALRDPATAVFFPVTLGKTRIQDLDQLTARHPSGLGLLVVGEGSSTGSGRAHAPVSVPSS